MLPPNWEQKPFGGPQNDLGCTKEGATPFLNYTTLLGVVWGGVVIVNYTTLHYDYTTPGVVLSISKNFRNMP